MMFTIEHDGRKIQGKRDNAYGAGENSPEKSERLSRLKLNSFDEHIYNASQANRGVITPDTLKLYTQQHFNTEEKRRQFMDYAKSRLPYLAWLGLVNDTGTSNQFYHERINVNAPSGESRKIDREYRPDFRYTATTLFVGFMGEFHRQKRAKAHEKVQKEIEDFKISNMHKYIFKQCENGEFSLKRYRQFISGRMGGKNLEREMAWKKASCEKLMRVGCFEKLDEDTYRATQKFIVAMKEAERVKEAQKLPDTGTGEFTPRPNHKRLLRLAVDGLLNFKDIEKSVKRLPISRQAREMTIKQGMLRKLVEAGYLEAVSGGKLEDDKGRRKNQTAPKPCKTASQTNQANSQTANQTPHPLIYKLTQKAMELMNEGSPTVEGPRDNQAAVSQLAMTEKEIKITAFDLSNIINPAIHGLLDREAIESSPRKASVEKRIKTLLAAGLLAEEAEGWRIKEEFYDRAKVRENINKEHEISHSRQHSLNCLTTEQKRTIADIKDFFNLLGSQILKHIYGGNELLYKGDISYLVKKGILARDKLRDIYILTKQGTKLATELTGDLEIFGSKINSKREELRHDLLLYSAFKDLEAELKAKGKVITLYKTDRKLKSEDMKETGRMREEYPDLYVEYRDELTGEKGTINIEVDVGYSEKAIVGKLSIPNLRWYTNKQSQKEKVLRKAKDMYVKIIEDEYWKSHRIKR